MSQPYYQAVSSSHVDEGSWVRQAGEDAVQALRDELPVLADRTLEHEEIQSAIAQLKLDRAVLRARLLDDPAEWASTVAPEVARVQEAMRAIAAAGGSRLSRVATENRMPLVIPAYLAILLSWLAIGASTCALAVLWSEPPSHVPSAVAWSALIVVGCAALVATACAAVLERSLGVHGVYPFDRFSLAVQVVGIEAAVALPYLVGPYSFEALGAVWATAVWVLAGAVVLVAFFFGSAFYFLSYEEGTIGYVLIGSAGAVTALTALALGWEFRASWDGGGVGRAVAVAGHLAGLAVLAIVLRWVQRRTTRQNAVREAVLAAKAAERFIIGWSSPRVRPSTSRTGSSAPELRSWVPLADRQRLERDLAEAESAWRAAVLQRGMLPLLRKTINEIVEPGHSLRLRVHDAPGLRQMRSTEYIVETRLFERFRHAVEGIRGGAVGIAGPRGAGKTTLLEAVATGRVFDAGEIPPLVVMEAVPVKYDAREFLLHLYAQVCTALLSPEEMEERRLSSDVHVPVHTLLRLAAFLVGWSAVAIVGHRLLHDDIALEEQLADAWWVLVVVLGAVGLLLCLAGAMQGIRARSVDRPRTADSFDALVRSAERRLQQVRFQQRFTTGWSGKITATVGAELSGTRTTELTAVARSYPEIVHDFRGLLSEVLDVFEAADPGGSRHVVVIIDELDKISSAAEAERFINEIKSIFTLDRSGYLFLVSVSEEALASFEQEGLAARDAFNSAFDDIQRIEYLTLIDTSQLLRSRIIGLSDPFVCLCHCLSGGLPREIVRVARDVVEGGSTADSTLSAVAARLVSQDLRDRLNGLDAALRSLEGCEPWTSDFLVAVRGSLAEPATAGALLAVADQPPLSAMSCVGSVPEDVTALLRVQLVTLTHLYFAATVLDVFHDRLTVEQTARGRRDGGVGSFDELASVRAQIASRPRRAWLTVSSFRRAWDLTVLDPPPVGPELRVTLPA